MLRDGYGLLIGGEYDTLEFTPTPQVKQVVFFFPLALEKGLFCFQTEILVNFLNIYIFKFFCLLLHRHQFAASYFSTSFNNCTDPGLQMGYPAPLIGL